MVGYQDFSVAATFHVHFMQELQENVSLTPVSSTKGKIF